ncbi:GUN4 domain-containing protein [Aerosakkonema funiforme]|uniref:GUN4 domain-containing protein n=1 Tax=Aerosakkonema funiforme TaxID=1246630 RepID=UPI0035B791B4
MSLCINPHCPKPDNPQNSNNRQCQSCGSDLLLQGRYRVMRLLSDNSGFGKIYTAEQRGTAKILKVLKEHLNKEPKAVELFQQEANVLAQFQHPGIPKVDGYFEYQTRNGLILHCIVMEKIEGPNLEEWLKQQGNHPISEQQAIAWLKQLAEILQIVHGKQYFHRDIKPPNIMLRRDGQLVLIDFGTAREATYTYLARLGAGYQITAIVSVGYTPPEQQNCQAVPQSDFFALGRTFVYLLTGQNVFNFYDPHNDVFRWRQAANISPILANFIDNLMARKPGDRPHNTQVLLQRIDELAQKLAKRKTNFPLGMAAGVLLVFGGGIGFWVSKLGGSSVSLPSPLVTSSPSSSASVVRSVAPISSQRSISITTSLDYTQLENLLKLEIWKEADVETRNIMLKASGREEGWLDIKSIDSFPCKDLAHINKLWVKYSKGKFGFSVQKSIWEAVGGSSQATPEIYNRFGDRVGWRVNKHWLKYDEYNFTMNSPIGHLPQMFNNNKLPSNKLSVLAPKLAKCGIP